MEISSNVATSSVDDPAPIRWHELLFQGIVEALLFVTGVVAFKIAFDDLRGKLPSAGEWTGFVLMLTTVYIGTKLWIVRRGPGIYRDPMMMLRTRMNLMFTTGVLVIVSVAVRMMRHGIAVGDDSVGVVAIALGLTTYGAVCPRRISFDMSKVPGIRWASYLALGLAPALVLIALWQWHAGTRSNTDSAALLVAAALMLAGGVMQLRGARKSQRRES